MGHLGHLSPVSSPPVKPNGHRPHIEPLSLNVKPQDNTKVILPVILLFCIKHATLLSSNTISALSGYYQHKAVAMTFPLGLFFTITQSLADPPTPLRRRHPQTVIASTSSYKIGIKTFLNPEGHQHRITGSKVTAILLKRWILPIGGASSVEGLRSTGLPRLVFFL